MIEGLQARFIVWWHINVFGRLHLGEFLRYVLEENDRPMRDQGETP